MKVLDPGHKYALDVLDDHPSVPPENLPNSPVVLPFVKREGPKYPGNVGSYPGTTLQETWRAGIDRLIYLDIQQMDFRNGVIIGMLRTAIKLLEERAAEKHGRVYPRFFGINIEDQITCPHCLHIGCKGECAG